MPKKGRYFDYAAATPVDSRVVSAMMPFFQKKFGNPSSLYKLGREAGFAVANSEEKIAEIFGCRRDEVVFTGSATEADNLAISGVAKASCSRMATPQANKILVTEIEHKGILAVCDNLQKEGFEIVKIPVKSNGLVDLNALKRELDEKTILVSVTMADSETGTIQPIKQISKIIRDFKKSKIKSGGEGDYPYFHTDASQAAGYLPVKAGGLGADLVTLSSHKIYGPKGIGCLYVKKGVKIKPIIYGGGHINPLRSGTTDVPSVVGFAKAMEITDKRRGAESVRIKKLRDILEKGIFKSIPKVVLNGHPHNRLPNFLNISILDIEGEALLLYLDELGIMVNTGSACNSQSLEPSYVLTALGRPYEFVHGSIRFSLGRRNTAGDVKYVLKHLPVVVKKLRRISPLELSAKDKNGEQNQKAFIGNQTPHFLRTRPSLKLRRANKQNEKS